MTRRRDWWLPLLFALCIVRLWLMALPSSFWVDETVTAFVVEHPHDRSLEAAPQVPASLYYAVARAAVQLGGGSEVAYRLPSVVAMLAAVWLIARLAARLIDRDAAWFAAFAALAIYGIDYFAVDARPYGLGILAATACVWFLVAWFDKARWMDAAGFAVCAALVWRIHLAYWPFYFVIAIYAGVRLRRTQTAVAWWQVAVVFAAIAGSLITVAMQALALQRQASAHVIVPPPSWRDFLHLLRWNVVAIAAVGAWIVGRRRQAPRPSAAILIGPWWLGPPLILYAVSIATGHSLYVTRYLSVALPGVALAATVAAAWFLPARWWRAAAGVMGVGALAAHGQWNVLWPVHEKSGWRQAAEAVNRSAAPVICPSPFIEAGPPVWRPDYRLPGFLYAHLAYYPIRGEAILFPFEDSPEAEDYAAQVLTSMRGGFLMYGGAGQVTFWQKWFAEHGRPGSVDRFGDVYVAHFSPPK
jgi:hypothetical protein